jgi:hypothetical protein
MLKVILPTIDLCQEFENFELLMSFYEGGLRGVIRDLILVNENYQYNFKYQDEDLIDKIVRDYKNSPDAVISYISENTDKSEFIYLASLAINRSVTNMMAAIFQRTVFDICKERWRWIGDDLCIHIEVLEDRFDLF